MTAIPDLSTEPVLPVVIRSVHVTHTADPSPARPNGRHIVTSNLITEIHNTLPGYRDTCEQIKRLRTLPPPVEARTVWNTQQLATELLLARLETGDPVDDLRSDIAQAVAEHGAAGLEFNARRDAITALKGRLETILNSSGDRILAGLNERFQTWREEIEALAPYPPILTAEAALASKRLQDAEHLAELLEQLHVMRREQVRALKSMGEDVMSKRSIAAFISNVEDVHDDWAVWLSHGYRVSRTGQEQRPVPPTWPIGGGEVAGTSAAFAEWALRNGANLWMPTAAEYRDYADSLRTKSREPRADTKAGEWRDPASLPTPGKRRFSA